MTKVSGILDFNEPSIAGCSSSVFVYFPITFYFHSSSKVNLFHFLLYSLPSHHIRSFLFSSILPHLHCMCDNPEQLWLTEAVIEHWDKYFSPPLHFILPENVAFLASVGADTLTREYDRPYPR